jgi:hypothetical protein
MAGSRLTNRIRIGQHVHITQNCTIAHDAPRRLRPFILAQSSLETYTREGVLVSELGPCWSRSSRLALVEDRCRQHGPLLRGGQRNRCRLSARVARSRPPGWHLEAGD